MIKTIYNDAMKTGVKDNIFDFYTCRIIIAMHLTNLKNAYV